MEKQHHYSISVQWTGNSGTGTSGYQSYERSHSIRSQNKIEILSSSDTAFRGDTTKYNPEELLVASISSCHMLWYLHLCSEAGVIVVDYIDNAEGMMRETNNGAGVFSEVTLHPVVTVSDESMLDKANEIHKKANAMCFIANSVKFPVYHKPTSKVKL